MLYCFIYDFCNVSVSLQLYSKRNDNLTNTIASTLESRIESHMKVRDANISTARCAKAGDIKAEIPVLVLCIQSSRLGTDANIALSDIKGMILLLYITSAYSKLSIFLFCWIQTYT